MQHRILIIEDNETNLELMSYLLQEFGHQLLLAMDGAAGLAKIKREKPDLVLCDIQMPKLDGYELARTLKADPELRGIIIVAVSALAMAGDREKGLAAGFDGYISKPIDAKTFVQQVEKLLQNAHSPSNVVQPKKSGTILVVDDLTANTELLESLLEPLGYNVITACGMTDAMALARQHLPALIISDVRMYEGSGFDFCEALKIDPRLKHIPFILITSTYCDEVARARGLALGAMKYIFRPIDSQILQREIAACLPKAQ